MTFPQLVPRTDPGQELPSSRHRDYQQERGKCHLTLLKSDNNCKISEYLMMSSRKERNVVASSGAGNLIAMKLSSNHNDTEVSEDFFTLT